MPSWLRPVAVALDDRSHPVEIFIRDDDAGWDDARLYNLLDLFQRHDTPIDLAVIPAELRPELAANLLARAADSRLGMHTHGFSHANHEHEGRKHEFGPSRPQDAQMHDIRTGKALLEDTLGDRFDAIFTPPWNRCTSTTARCLVAAGYRVLSRDATAEPIDSHGLRQLPVGVDWLRKRQGRGIDKAELATMIAQSIQHDGPSGIMLHHAAMSASDLDDVDELLRLFASSDRVRYGLMREFGLGDE